MHIRTRLYRFAFLFVLLALVSAGVDAQKKSSSIRWNGSNDGRAILWQPVNIADQDLFAGPGGDMMRPDLSSITFIKRETGGHNKKYRIKDGSGRIWVAKPGTEARPETAAVRLLHGLGYETEINYLVPEITIPSVGTLRNVRLEARPDNIKRLDPWKWRSNPFVGTNQLQGLKIMQVFMTNYDLLDMQNQVLAVDTPGGSELHYIISDLGSTFGRFGSNNLPIFFRIGRSADNPRAWSKAKFIKGVKDGRIVFATTGAKSRGLFKDITVAQGRWLYNLLAQLKDEQFRDAFRAANYSPAEVDMLTAAAKRRITELERATNERFAEQKRSRRRK
jgi:hypothetical protein